MRKPPRKNFRTRKKLSSKTEAEVWNSSKSSSSLFKTIGIGVVIGVIVVALTNYPTILPNLSIVDVQDGASNSDSRFIIRNTGFFAAENVKISIELDNLGISGWTIKNLQIKKRGENGGEGVIIKKLSKNEAYPVPACSPYFGADPDIEYGACKYQLNVTYELRFLIRLIEFSTAYEIELRKSKKGSTWHYTPLTN